MNSSKLAAIFQFLLFFRSNHSGCSEAPKFFCFRILHSLESYNNEPSPPTTEAELKILDNIFQCSLSILSCSRSINSCDILNTKILFVS